MIFVLAAFVFLNLIISGIISLDAGSLEPAKDLPE